MRALVDPSPPALLVDPVLVAAGPTDSLVAGFERELADPQPRASSRWTESSRPARATGSTRQAFGDALRSAVLRGRRWLSAPIVHVEPERTTAAAEEALATAQELVAEPVVLSFKGEDVGSLTPERLAKLVRFRPDGDRFRVTFAPDRIAKAVEPFLGEVASASRQRALRRRREGACGSGRRGRASRPTGAWISDSISAAAASSIRRASLRLKQTRADLTTDEANRLGIRERISTFTTDMGTSSSNRIHNVQLMAEYIDGTIVEPGQEFSFNDRVGPRTVERGFREGQMIIGSLLLPSIGGGVCQTATTLFNNAFELGLPIVERHNHSFYISHYPMGRDATVSWGGPDFAFRNDLKTGILIKTRYTSSTLTFSFYGTDPGRRIVSTTGSRVNWRSPQTTYALDPYAPRGSVRTVSGSNQSGFDVTVTRKIYEHGKLKRQRRLHEQVHRRRPDADLRPRPLDPRPVLRAAARLVYCASAFAARRERAVLLVALDDDPHRLGRVVGRVQEVDVVG